MIIRLGLENKDENRSIAWALDYPGCFAYGHDGETALAAMPTAFQEYCAWIEKHSGERPWLVGEFSVKLEETWEVYSIDENYALTDQGYSVNAWFLNDWKPLTQQEIEHGLKLLEWSRVDLLETARPLSQETRETNYPNERWNIDGILKHVGGAEWWYLHRLGLAFPREEVPQEAFERLEVVRKKLAQVLPTLAGSKLVAGIDGEFWSPRKLLRRAIWHERDHNQHIRKLIGKR